MGRNTSRTQKKDFVQGAFLEKGIHKVDGKQEENAKVLSLSIIMLLFSWQGHIYRL